MRLLINKLKIKVKFSQMRYQYNHVSFTRFDNSASGFSRGQVGVDMFVHVVFGREKICCCLWTYSFHVFYAGTITTPLETCFPLATSGSCEIPDIRKPREHQTLTTPARWSDSHWEFRREPTPGPELQRVFIKEASEKGENRGAPRLWYPHRNAKEQCIHSAA